MTRLYETIFPRTLDGLVTLYGSEAMRGTQVEAWVFDDEPTRRAAEQALAVHGVQAKFRSAYKPLVCAVLEEIDAAALARMEIIYPVHPAAPANRFLLEAYPLSALLGPCELEFTPGGAEDFYHLTLTDRSGRQTVLSLRAPNRLHTDAVGQELLSPTGWLTVTGPDGVRREGRLETDYELLFAEGIAAIQAWDWGETEPYFEELSIEARLPFQDRPLPYGAEVMSLTEALHEDFYFALLEIFQQKSGRPLGDRGLQPGQIVPDIRTGPGPLTLVIETHPLNRADTPVPVQPLDQAEAPLGAAQIYAELATVPGVAFAAISRAGRTIAARYHAGTDAPVMISGGQHANETSGIVGALRAGKLLAARAGAHFTLAPLENPDGYALHRRLCAANPRHMHHAARYTALGDDLEYRADPNLFERAIRTEARRLSGAQLHVNLHGYPSHEWTRPLSGYVPRGFALWTVPKGFFLVVRHHQVWAERAEIFLDEVTGKLAALPGLLAFNAAQVALYERHAGETGFRLINGFPCLISVDDRSTVPLTLITEYPDETIYGPAFIAAHTAQQATVLAAYEAFQALARA